MFDVYELGSRLTRLGDPLVGLNAMIKWGSFRPLLERVYEKERKSNAGAKPIDPVLMFKILILQRMHNLCDDETEYQIRDRFSFRRFLGLQLEDRVPDAKTIWLFKERLKDRNLGDEIFHLFEAQIKARGLVLRSGQIIDATFVEVPRQHNNREENATIKEGKAPEAWKDPNKLRQKDLDARWTKKNNETFYGYKNHVNVDNRTKLIQEYAVSDASVHDSQVFEEILDYEPGPDGKRRSVHADSAYRSAACEEMLAQDGIESHIHEKGARNNPLSEEQKKANKVKSSIRVRVEHVFAAQSFFGGDFIRTIGIKRAKLQIALANLLYNMLRLGQLLRLAGGSIALLSSSV